MNSRLKTVNQMRRVRSKKEMMAAIHQFKEAAEEEFKAILITSSFSLYQQMGILTPKDTGWASQHWSLSTNPHNEEEVTIDLTEFKMGDTIHVFNNVVYIKRLDEGHSQQRPIGFTFLAMNYITTELNTKFEEYKKRRYE